MATTAPLDQAQQDLAALETSYDVNDHGIGQPGTQRWIILHQDLVRDEGQLETAAASLADLEDAYGVEDLGLGQPGTQRWIILHQDLVHSTRELVPA